jgi:hypothetical protein
MQRKVSATTRLLHELFTQYPSTFRAFCELINNSIQARAKHIYITIDYAQEGEMFPTAVTRIVVRDDGHGVHVNEIQNRLLDFGDSTKKGGKGVGRFAALQIGCSIEIETVGYDRDDKTYSKVKLPFQEQQIKSVRKVEELIIDTEETILKGKNHKTYYEVTITSIYDPIVTGKNLKRKISEKLLKDKIFTSIFERYPLAIFAKDIIFTINGKVLDSDNYVDGEPERKRTLYTDKKGDDHELYFTYIKLKGAIEEIKVFLTTKNVGVDTIVASFAFEADWLDPHTGGWFIYIHSESLATDLYRNVDLEEMDEEGDAFRKFIKARLTDFFKSRNKKYDEFVEKLQQDSAYPYKKQERATSLSQVVLFEKLAYLVEEKYNLIKKKNKLREIIYPLIDRTILSGELDRILQDILKLDSKRVQKFNVVLNRSTMEEVIEFSDKVSRKIEDLAFIEKLTVTEIARHVAERKELHKVMEKTLWIFGEQYLDNTTLLSDKNLENNLRSLREQTMVYKPSAQDDNLNKTLPPKTKSITDLFLYSEKPIDEVRREVLIVELKAPKVKLGMTELQQALRYAEEIENSRFYTNDITFNIILISSDFNRAGKYHLDGIEKPRENPYFFWKNAAANITVSVMRWAQLLENNKRKLRYLSGQLEVKDKGVEQKIKEDFSEITFDNLKSKLRKVKGAKMI